MSIAIPPFISSVSGDTRSVNIEKEGAPMSIATKPFGTTKTGQKVTAWTLTNSAGLSAVILDLDRKSTR